MADDTRKAEHENKDHAAQIEALHAEVRELKHRVHELEQHTHPHK